MIQSRQMFPQNVLKQGLCCWGDFLVGKESKDPIELFMSQEF